MLSYANMDMKSIKYTANLNNVPLYFLIRFLYLFISTFTASLLAFAQEFPSEPEKLDLQNIARPESIRETFREDGIGQNMIPSIDNLTPLITLKFLTLDGANHPWTKYIGDFRGGHHFYIFTGFVDRTYYLDKFKNIEYLRASSQNILSKFAYDFHLPLYKGLGYALGSEFGGNYAYSHDSRISFDKMSIEYPGFRGSLTYNLNPLFRFGILGGVFVERMLRLAPTQIESSTEESREISINYRIIDRAFFIDYFYALNWGLRFEYHRRHATYRQPINSRDKALDAQIYLKDEIYNLGLILHIF